MVDLKVGIIGFLADESAATAIEYGLIAAGIAVACIVAITAFGNSLLGLFVHVDERAGEVMDNAGI
jgi:pilus assembly protein Flp/PilA